MLERRRSLESIGLELAALRVEHALQANLISRLTDALYMTPEERDVLAILVAQIEEVAAWTASRSSTLSTPSAGSSVPSSPLA